MEDDHLYDMAMAASDEESFVAFLNALALDKKAEDEREAKTPSPPYGPGAMGWEHGTIAAFLDGAVACWKENQRNSSNSGLGNPWQICALILYRGKYYE